MKKKPGYLIDLDGSFRRLERPLVFRRDDPQSLISELAWRVEYMGKQEREVQITDLLSGEEIEKVHTMSTALTGALDDLRAYKLREAQEDLQRELDRRDARTKKEKADRAKGGRASKKKVAILAVIEFVARRPGSQKALWDWLRQYDAHRRIRVELGTEGRFSVLTDEAGLPRVWNREGEEIGGSQGERVDVTDLPLDEAKKLVSADGFFVYSRRCRRYRDGRYLLVQEKSDNTNAGEIKYGTFRKHLSRINQSLRSNAPE